MKLFLVFILLCVGCTTITGYHKKVTVKKDGEGKTTSILVEEEIHQPDLKMKAMNFKYLDE